MTVLRNIINSDAGVLQQFVFTNMSIEEIKEMIVEWDKKRYRNKYFEMFAILNYDNIVGTISLYQHSKDVISLGPEVFSAYRQQGFARKAMILAMEKAKDKGYKIISQQIRIDNTASIALHRSLDFQTDGYVYINKRGNEVAIYLRSLL